MAHTTTTDRAKREAAHLDHVETYGAGRYVIDWERVKVAVLVTIGLLWVFYVLTHIGGDGVAEQCAAALRMGPTDHPFAVDCAAIVNGR